MSRTILSRSLRQKAASPFANASLPSVQSRGRASAVEPQELSHEAASPVDSIIPRPWKRAEVSALYNMPIFELMLRAANVHKAAQPKGKVQLCTLMNIKEGGCSEDCGYCSQSSRYTTPSTPSKLSDVDEVLIEARKAKENGSTRFCMGAAWREVGGRKRGFNRILEMVSEIRGMGMEVCTTLGMLTPEQAMQLKNAGLTAYNHNLDTSREYYGKVVTSRTYDDRLSTLEAVRDAGISVCSGGILGLGEEEADRVGLIWEMSKLPEPPESFPVNALVAIPGTPMEGNEPVSIQTMLRTIATARIVLPTSIIRMAAGRQLFSESEQAMCFMAGANAIFTGHRMLTTPTSGWDEDKSMLARWDLQGMHSFEDHRVATKTMDSAAPRAEQVPSSRSDVQGTQNV